VAVGGTCVGGTLVGVTVGGITVAEGDNVDAGIGCFDPEQDVTSSTKRLMINRKTISFTIEPPFSISQLLLSIISCYLWHDYRSPIQTFLGKQSLCVYVTNSVAR
jgi:hypothetical protein